MTKHDLRNAAHGVTVAHDGVTACLDEPSLTPKVASMVEEFRLACEVLDLEHQLYTGRRVRPEEALALATHLSRDDTGEMG